MWLLEFIFGMFLAYLIMSPRLRNFIFRRDTILRKEPTLEERAKVETNLASSKSSTPIDKHGKVFTTEEELSKWLAANPECKVREK